ncbi:MAG: hypothetical protein AAGA78_11925 [Pseudomonadota bacterium]
MRPRLIFSYGVTKSGSTYAFQICAEALKRAGFAQPRLPAEILGAARTINAVEHLTERDLTQIETLASAWSTRLVLKTHTPPDGPVRDWIRSGRAEAHAIYRDPRDVALSMLDHGRKARAAGRPAFAEFRCFDDTLKGLDNQMVTLAAWLSLPGTLPLSFETLTLGHGPAALLAHHHIPGEAARLCAHVRQSCFIQYNKGVQARHGAEMSPQTAARFRARYAPFYAWLYPQPPKNNPVLPPGTPLCAMDNPPRGHYPQATKGEGRS